MSPARRLNLGLGVTRSAAPPPSVLNVARIGEFNPDRAIHDYCRNIRKVQPIGVAE